MTTLELMGRRIALLDALRKLDRPFVVLVRGKPSTLPARDRRGVTAGGRPAMRAACRVGERYEVTSPVRTGCPGSTVMTAGTLQLSRALADPQLADQVLDQGIHNALALLGIEHEGNTRTTH
ncbi:hypothetical protein OK074_4136 [Actinobacteria bacterium OK074]|nr:hypothetical protein OK074_4136 [Actinobacteria bacterium OK074]